MYVYAEKRVAAGLKAAIHNPNVSEEAKEHSRQVLEEIEGTSDKDAFIASAGSKKSHNYNADAAAQKADRVGSGFSTLGPGELTSQQD